MNRKRAHTLKNQTSHFFSLFWFLCLIWNARKGDSFAENGISNASTLASLGIWETEQKSRTLKTKEYCKQLQMPDICKRDPFTYCILAFVIWHLCTRDLVLITFPLYLSSPPFKKSFFQCQYRGDDSLKTMKRRESLKKLGD